jgi:hypothetical protein
VGQINICDHGVPSTVRLCGVFVPVLGETTMKISITGTYYC